MKLIEKFKEKYPGLFFMVLKWTVILNVASACIGGTLWFLLLGSANSIESAYDLYWKLQPLKQLPEWMISITSYGFITIIALNVIVLLLCVVGYVVCDEPHGGRRIWN